jgi:hypothetical protein
MPFRTILFVTLMVSFMFTPTQGNISLQLFEGEDGTNPFLNTICSMFTCGESGGPEIVTEMEDFVKNLLDGGTADININVDGGGRVRKLRGSESA